MINNFSPKIFLSKNNISLLFVEDIFNRKEFLIIIIIK